MKKVDTLDDAIVVAQNVEDMIVKETIEKKKYERKETKGYKEVLERIHMVVLRKERPRAIKSVESFILLSASSEVEHVTSVGISITSILSAIMISMTRSDTLIMRRVTLVLISLRRRTSQWP